MEATNSYGEREKVPSTLAPQGPTISHLGTWKSCWEANAIVNHIPGVPWFWVPLNTPLCWRVRRCPALFEREYEKYFLEGSGSKSCLMSCTGDIIEALQHYCILYMDLSIYI